MGDKMYKHYLEERNRLLDIGKSSSLYEVAKVWEEQKENILAMGKISQYFIWDYELMKCGENTLHISPEETQRLIPLCEYTNGEKYPNIEEFEVERIAFYTECLSYTSNLAMKIRYTDYLFEYCEKKDKFLIGNRLCGYLMEYLGHSSKDEEWGYISKMSRLIDVAVMFKKEDIIAEIVPIIFKKIEELQSESSYLEIKSLLTLTRYFMGHKKLSCIKDADKQQIISYIQESRDRLINDKNIHIYILFIEELIEWFKVVGKTQEEILVLRVEIGKALEIESDYQGGRAEKSDIVKAHFIEQAIKHYINIGEIDKVNSLKVKLKETYKSLIQGDELKTFETTVEIPNQVIEDILQPIIVDDKRVAVLRLCLNQHFIPGKEGLLEDAKKTCSEMVFSQLASLSKIYSDRKVQDSSSSNDNLEQQQFYSNYDIYLKMVFSTVFKEGWDRLVKKGLTQDDVIEDIIGWKYMSNDDAAIVKVGITRYFEEDFISALHILIPRFENCFRNFFIEGGYPTISIKDGITQHEQNFNDFLLNDYVAASINNDLLFMVRFVMVEQSGYNLRNNIAHGLARIEEFNRTIADMVLVLYYNLINYRWENRDNNVSKGDKENIC